MLAPSGAYRDLGRRTRDGAWVALRRPLALAFVLGCCVSFVSAGRLTPRLIAGGAVSLGFVPLLEMGLLALFWRKRPAGSSFARVNDLFFMGYGPLLLWLMGFAGLAAWASPAHASGWSTPPVVWPFLGSLLPVLAWSAYIGFVFFRDVVALRPGRAAGALLLQRAIFWSVAIAYFLGHSGWPLVAGRLGL